MLITKNRLISHINKTTFPIKYFAKKPTNKFTKEEIEQRESLREEISQYNRDIGKHFDM